MYVFTRYRDSAGEWRWNLRAANNRIVADSGEGYSSRAACMRSIGRFRTHVLAAPVAPKRARKIVARRHPVGR